MTSLSMHEEQQRYAKVSQVYVYMWVYWRFMQVDSTQRDLEMASGSGPGQGCDMD